MRDAPVFRRTCAGCMGFLTLASCGTSSPTVSTTASPPRVTNTTSVATTSTTAATTTPPLVTTTRLVATTTTSSRLPTTATSAQGSVPARVTDVRTAAAGGSGEIELVWGGVADAAGYRVYRALAPGGPFSKTADYDVATGTSTKASGVTNVYYTSEFGFVYVELVSDSQTTGPKRYYRVTAYNAAGEGAASEVVCGAPTAYPSC